MKRRREFERATGATKGATARGNRAAAQTERNAPVEHDTGLSAEGRRILRLQSLVGNAQVQRLLVQRAPEDGQTIEMLITSLRDVTAPPPVEMFWTSSVLTRRRQAWQPT